VVTVGEWELCQLVTLLSIVQDPQELVIGVQDADTRVDGR
jgi:hypothetical protein